MTKNMYAEIGREPKLLGNRCGGSMSKGGSVYAFQLIYCSSNPRVASCLTFFAIPTNNFTTSTNTLKKKEEE